MRLVYLDEAGVSNPAHEPHLVVAGVIVHPDRHWRKLETYFRDLARDLFPDEDPYRFVFHAKDIWHGSKLFDRNKWPRNERMKIMNQLAQVPRLFDLTIVVGHLDRIKAKHKLQKMNPGMSDKAVHNFTHTHAFINAIQMVQFWMDKECARRSRNAYCRRHPRNEIDFTECSRGIYEQRPR